MNRLALGAALVAALAVPYLARAPRRALPPPLSAPQAVEPSGPSAPRALRIAVLAGGCFWGVEAVYEHIKGVTEVVSGYAGGSAKDADYDLVSSGRTAHAEAVRITYDPAQISYAQILHVFFSVVHDPTQLNRQGPDVGPQYRSAIFFGDDEQARAARAYIDQLTGAKAFRRPIVTQVVRLEAFYAAEPYHQDFAARNPDHPYIVFHDRPKVENLRAQFPALFRATGAEAR